jgi:hypothetical protein
VFEKKQRYRLKQDFFKKPFGDQFSVCGFQKNAFLCAVGSKLLKASHPVRPVCDTPGFASSPTGVELWMPFQCSELFKKHFLRRAIDKHGVDTLAVSIHAEHLH